MEKVIKYIKEDLMWHWLISVLIAMLIIISIIPAYLAINIHCLWWLMYLIIVPLYWFTYIDYKNN